METNRLPARRGAALILTIVLLSGLTLVLVGFLTAMNMERRAAVSVADAERAKLVAFAALNHATDILRTNIPDPARLSEGPQTAPAINWISNPGRLTIVSGTSRRTVDLHTGEVTEPPLPNQPRNALSVDLNEPLPGQTAPAITGWPDGPKDSRPPMRVKWVNLYEHPAELPGPNNPLTARYAFWMDDETARLNFNTASGKPASGSEASTSGSPTDADYTRQLGKFLTPTFALGTGASSYSGVTPRYALGRPQSVNFDILFKPDEKFLRNELTDHIFLHGYQRFPEAIFNFAKFTDSAAKDAWFERERFNFTHYNRSPEFNAFNRSRFFTTYVPLSTEGGPSYQHPFLYDPTGAYDGKSGTEVLHLNSLLGTFGYTSAVTDEDGGKTLGGNVVNRFQVEMLTAYLHRTWPGYTASFAQKYGEAGVRQIAINAVLMARMATSQIDTSTISKFSKAYSLRSTSANYAAASNELPGKTPERCYWRFPADGGKGLYLPQTPGPHITEVRLCVKAVPVDIPPKNDATQLKGVAAPRYLQYWYEAEYYMHPHGPVVDVSEFPVRMDYFEIEVTGHEKTRQQFGPEGPGIDRFDADWNDPSNLGRLLIQAPKPGGTKPVLTLGSAGTGSPNRLVLTSEIMTYGQRPAIIPKITGEGKTGDYSQWDPVVFDAAKDTNLTAAFRLRPGLSINEDPQRPRQMIPLGETREDTLKGTFTVPLIQVNRDLAISWQINDPRLSHDLHAWEEGMMGPGNKAEIGTPGAENTNKQGQVPWAEAAENSADKSKFRYLERAQQDVKIDGQVLDRPDEFNLTSRISSPGYWSLLHTGMQSKKAWQTLNLGPESGQNSPPDWLLLDLIGATFPLASDQFRLEGRRPDEFSTASFMNSTAGQVNINTRIYPQNEYFQPPARTKPIQAVFTNLPNVDAAGLAGRIAAYQQNRAFEYVGELANALGTGGTDPWEREFAMRNMAGVLTTKSNTFGVWGVAQVVKKMTQNKAYDRLESGDVVLAEKRFHAIVERYIWPGLDGVPGNGHANGAGMWDRLARQTNVITPIAGQVDTVYNLPGSPPLQLAGKRLNLDATGTYPEYDGPEAVGTDPFAEKALGKIQFRRSRLEEAYNPPQAVMKYRVVTMQYLDE